MHEADQPITLADDSEDKTQPPRPEAGPDLDALETNASADGGDPAVRPVQPRAQIRAAINSLYNTPRLQTRPLVEPSPPKVEPVAPEPEPEPAIDPVELQKAAEVQSLIARGQLLAKQGQLDASRKLFSQAIQRDPLNSEAWTWLGGLFVNDNPDRAKVCLSKALEIDPTNERAQKGLAQLEARLEAARPKPEQSLAIVPVEESGVLDIDPEQRSNIRIGLEEAVEKARQSGVETDPEKLPVGGPRIRPAVERGELKLPKYRRHRIKLPELPKTNKPKGYVVSLLVLSSFVFIILAGLLVAFAASPLNPLTAPTPDPYITPTETPEPTTTPVPLTVDENFAARLRTQMEQYTRLLVTASSLRQQVQKGKMPWDEYRRNIKSLQTEIKNQKKSVDELARDATPKLLNYYRDLQTIAATTIQAVDFTTSGVENTNPEDLEEGNRQFVAASQRLAELTTKLNQASPVPTVQPIATPRPTSTPRPTTTTDITPGPTVIETPLETVQPATPAPLTPGAVSPTADSSNPTASPTPAP